MIELHGVSAEFAFSSTAVVSADAGAHENGLLTKYRLFKKAPIYLGLD
jgi:hypothetical protein